MTEQAWINPEVDRSDWGPGPWDGEPDKVQWVDPATGYPCIASRGNPRNGAWCGYVAIEPGHPLHGTYFTDAQAVIEVGLSFSDSCNDEAPAEYAVCHVPEPGKPADVWWLGFDFDHAWDIAPGADARDRKRGRLPVLREGERPFGADGPLVSYKTLSTARARCAELAGELKVLEFAEVPADA